jgi:hypothetical protein
LLGLALLTGCAAHDKDIVFAPGSYIHQCEKGYTIFGGSFGQYHVSGNGCNGGGQERDYDYEGDPEGPIVFRWKAIYYDPVKGKKAVDADTHRYFYAESHDAVKMPPRGDDHWLYEVHISFGPRRVWVREAVADENLKVVPYSDERGKTDYQVGEIDTLYHFARSRPRTWSAEWPRMEETPYRFKAIKGIELTEAQYMTIACEMVGTAKCNKRLEEDAPGLTPAQLAYLRAARGEGSDR